MRNYAPLKDLSAFAASNKPISSFMPFRYLVIVRSMYYPMLISTDQQVSEIPTYYVDGRDSQDLSSQQDDGKG